MDDPKLITYIGKVDYRNKMTKFGIKAPDRTKHMYIIGKTGTGKSTFLENMIVQDIQNGHGVAFIDPHGGSAEKLLDYIPDWRVNDVIYLNPADTNFPVAFNPLEDLGPAQRPLIADGLMSVFKKIWPEAFSGRMEYILNNTMLALLEYPEPSILGINRMLTDKDYRKKVVANVSDPTVKNAWDELMKWDDKRWSEAAGSLINKVGQFSTNPIIRNIIGQTRSTFDFRKAMDEQKIIIINLSKGQIGEQNAPLLGAMLITKIYLAAMSRSELPARVIEKMPPFYFFVDEFQNFANDSFANILSEARKYKLCLTVANQYIAQMEETIRDAVFGNMGSTVSFRVGPLDAEFMEKVFAPVFTMDDLQNIAFGQYYLTLQIDNMGSKPFSAQGLPPIPPLQTSMREQVIEASRRNFAKPKEEVEFTVNEWFGYNKKPDTKVVRSDIGNDHQGVAGQYQQRFEKREPVNFGGSRPKKIPELSNYQKKDTSRIANSQNDRLVRLDQSGQTDKDQQKILPKKNSDSLNSLLSQLDQLVPEDALKPTKPVVPEEKQQVKKDFQDVKPTSQSIKTPVKVENSEQKKKEVIIPKPVNNQEAAELLISKKNETRPIAPKNDRVASPEKKSALQEALAKAMAQSSQKKGEDTAGSLKQEVQNNREKERDNKVPETTTFSIPKPKTESLDTAKVDSLKTDQEAVTRVSIELPPSNKQVETSNASDELIPSVPVPPRKISTTPREVPEEILRSVLE